MIYELAQHPVGSGPHGIDTGFEGVFAGEGEYGNRGIAALRFQLANGADGVDTVHERHDDVHNDEIEILFFKEFNGFFTIAGLSNGAWQVAEIMGEKCAIVGAIVHQKYGMGDILHGHFTCLGLSCYTSIFKVYRRCARNQPQRANYNMSIDLHTHSTASDGTMTPTELVKHAKEVGLDAIALTDHDTLGGLEEAVAAGQEYGVEVIRGCELSLESPEGAGWMHVVALWVPENPIELQKSFDWVIEGRKNRNHEIVEKLRSLGINITYENVAARAGGTIGRPHFAQELVSLGVVSSINEAFKVWLGDDGRAYVPKRKLTPENAFKILKDIGATSILAHPFALGLNKPETESLVADLMKLGLDGMEVYYSEHNEADTKAYKEMAERLGLLISGGSDFHGTVKPKISLGKGKGGLRVPTELLEAMKADRRAKGLPL